MFGAMPCWPDGVGRLRTKIRSDSDVAGDSAAIAEQCAAGHRAFGVARENADALAALGKLGR